MGEVEPRQASITGRAVKCGECPAQDNTQRLQAMSLMCMYQCGGILKMTALNEKNIYMSQNETCHTIPCSEIKILSTQSQVLFGRHT